MILYFSGTGNSRYAAERIAGALGDTLISLNDRIRAGDTSPLAVTGPLVLVTPTYAWRIPRIVREHLEQTEIPPGTPVWFVMTCGSEIGNAAAYNRALCREKQLVCMGTAQLVMPENYIAMFQAPQAAEARQIVAKAEPDIHRAAAAIGEGRAFAPVRSSLYDRFMSGPVNPVFYSFFVRASAFTAGDACTGCGLCAVRCPTGNITLANGKPVWGHDCTHCMACICRCPAEAIEYGTKSLGKPRYHLEGL